ncbi:hypothetical protein LUZ61_005901 [Rhynchospora tenuis]|uniref:Peptide N-acetyl-beta-D-glucosaminyl asparaginase amidase A N-terminal domain-containing protein n=1 Tax=Rhynchospora tenuis TaxID=198213 RepID=A0AAD5ZQJ1_9POAL|nr:hypothetical protein LUZ61_005901 [Rhynchospora tenuis]
MTTSSFPLLLLLSLLPFSYSHLHKLKFTNSRLLHSDTDGDDTTSPTTYFEVTRPIPVPTTQPCSHLLLQHDFAYTYSKPPVTSSYTPPSCLTQTPSRIVLEWNATCKGRQYDRIFGVWLGGVELLRSCTAEPRATGIVWTVQKDVTKYSSLFFEESTFAVYLGNLVDSTYTGVYHVNVSLYFYFESDKLHQQDEQDNVPAFQFPADLLLPISRNLPLNDGLWFLIQNSTDIQTKELTIPSNAYRAVVEVYISFHSDDEFWYSNPPNDYISENNLTGVPGNGPFREVTIRLDGDVVGSVWPFTVIYTGGINPLLWRPITGIGSFNLPSYNIEITPFLGRLLDGKPHTFGFGVTNALDVWFVDANLHLWLDQKSSKTEGNLLKYEAPAYIPRTISKFYGLDGKFKINAQRRISSAGWVESSYGQFTFNFSQELHFQNFMEFSDNASTQLVRQTIESTYSTYVRNPYGVVYTEQVHHTFPLYIYTSTADVVQDNSTLATNITLGFDQKWSIGEKPELEFGFGFLTNIQNAHGDLKYSGNSITGGIGSTEEVYDYEGTDGCYFRNVSSSNYTILYDLTKDFCF